MKKEYDLKEVMNNQMKDVTMSTKLEETIKARCLGEGSTKALKGYQALTKVAIWAIGILFVCSGTVYAMNHIEGFNNFIDEAILQKISPHVQTINKGSKSGDVKLVVEAAITDHYNSLLAFSFINEGKEAWQEGIKAGSWDESWTTSGSYGPPVLSEDGRKLTYFVRGHGEKDILKNKTFKLEANNLIYRKKIEEQVDIPLGELFEAHGIVVDTIDYNYSTRGKELYMKLDRMLKKEVGSTQQIILKDEPKVTFEYVGMIQDSRLNDPRNPDGGLTLYTRNESHKYWTNSNDNYTVGTISEVTDIRTGQVYKANMRGIEHDVDTLWRGSLGVSQFAELMDPSVIPYLKATKIIYEVQEVVVDQNWKVEFQIEDTTTIEPIKIALDFTEGSESVTVEEVNCSVFGITIQGTKRGQLEDHTKDSIHDKMKLALRMKDDSVVELECFSMNAGAGRFISSYENRDRVFLNTEEIEAVIINGEEVLLLEETH